MLKQLHTVEQRYSVCVGVNTVATKGLLAPLQYAEDDAQAVDNALGVMGFPEEHRVLLLGGRVRNYGKGIF